MKAKFLLTILAIATMSGCSSDSSDDSIGNIETIISATPLQKALYIAEDDNSQPAWLQEKIKNSPYLKVYHSEKDGGRYLLEYPNRLQTVSELYNTDGQLQAMPTQEAFDAALTASAPWTCTHVYTYPIEVGSDEWRGLSVQERQARLQLPDNLLVNMRTEDLILVCLDYPFASDLFAFDDFQRGFMLLHEEFNGLRELMSRNDLAEPFLSYLDVNWQKAGSMKSKESLAIGQYTLMTVVFKYMLAQDAAINQMNSSQLRSMLDLCMRNDQIEQSDPETWSGVNLEATWYIYAKVIHNKGGFPFKDDREKRMFDAYIEHPRFFVIEEDSEIYQLFTDDFKERVITYIKNIA